MFRDLTVAAQILVDAIVSNALNGSNEETIDELTRDFIDLFKESPTRSFEETLGFFGELLVISNSSNPTDAINAWHSKFDNRYDFTNNNDRLEVKITSGRERHHHFSSNQLPVSKGIQLEILSMVTEEVEAGTTVASLFQELYLNLSDSVAKQKLRKAYIDFFRGDSKSAENISFDSKMAITSALVFRPETIPTPNLQPGVISANWISNFEPAVGQSYSLQELNFLQPMNEQ